MCLGWKWFTEQVTICINALSEMRYTFHKIRLSEFNYHLSTHYYTYLIYLEFLALLFS